MNTKDLATALIKVHEGLRLTIYADTKGFPTIGYGRSLATQGISVAEANVLLEDDVDYFLEKLGALPWFAGLDEIRQAAIVDIAFNLGVNGLLEFKNMIAALEKKDFALAAICMLQSAWAYQVGQRAVELSGIIRFGKMPGD